MLVRARLYIGAVLETEELHRRAYNAAFQIISQMHQKNIEGSVVSMVCDGGERYANTYFNQKWLKDNGFSEAMKDYEQKLKSFYQTGILI